MLSGSSVIVNYCTALPNVLYTSDLQLIDWLIDWLAGWLTDWLTDWLIDTVDGYMIAGQLASASLLVQV